MLVAPTMATIANAEKLLQELERPSAACQPLRVPVSPSHYQCGGLASSLQAIATWTRASNTEPSCITFNKSAFDANDAQSAVEHLPGLAACLLANDVISAAGSSIRIPTLHAAGKRIERMKNLIQNARGPSITLLCADRTSKRALPAFYHPLPDGNGFLKDEDQFVALMNEVLLIVVGPGARGEIAFDAEPLGVMMRELFDNTHRYAQADASGAVYSKSVRGTYIAHHDLAPIALERAAEGYAPLVRYFKAVERLFAPGKRARLLEISIFDTGPGLAARLNAAPIPSSTSAAEEYNLVRRCFMKNVGTVTRPGGGTGLSKVMSRLKAAGGFLRLRTGRLSLYKDFSAFNATANPLDPCDLELQDVGDAEPQLLPSAAGTVLTVVIPLKTATGFDWS